MALRFSTILLLSALFATEIRAHDHSKHPPHNMVLFGGEETFVSHIVYKQPHNFQVILRVRLNEVAQKAYLESRASNPKDLTIFLFDSMDIGEIQSKPRLTGKFIRQSDSGQRIVFMNDIKLEPDQYDIVFFDELPLSLEK